MENRIEVALGLPGPGRGLQEEDLFAGEGLFHELEHPSLGGAGLGEEVGAEVGGRGKRPALLFHEEGLHVGLPGEEVLD